MIFGKLPSGLFVLVVSQLLFASGVLCKSSTSSYLKNEPSVSVFSQKYISYNNTIDKIPLIGIDLRSTIFEPHGYSSGSLSYLSEALNNRNINALLIDLYWNTNLHGWQLCPISTFSPPISAPKREPNLNITGSSGEQTTNDNDDTLVAVSNSKNILCQYNFTLSNLFETIPYNNGTSTQYAPNIKQLIFTLHSLDTTTASKSMSVTRNLSQALNDTFGDALYTPEEHKSAGYLYPTMYNFLFKRSKGIFPMIWESDLSTNSSYTLNSSEYAVFYAGENQDSDFQYSFYNFNDIDFLATNFSQSEYDTLNSGSWKFTSVNNTDASMLREIMLNGITAIILDNPTLNYTLLEQISWAWQLNQPENSKKATFLADHNQYIFSVDKRAQKALQCAVLYQKGWYVENCYNSHYVACQSRSNALHWKITKNRKSYFEASDSCVDNPHEQFNFSLPKMSLVQSYLIYFLQENNISDPVWVDFNTIASEDCWVSGGPDSLCPYRDVYELQRFIGIIAPICVFIIFIISLIFVLGSQKVPVQKNRKYWKKLVADFTENEYEGVPA